MDDDTFKSAYEQMDLTTLYELRKAFEHDLADLVAGGAVQLTEEGGAVLGTVTGEPAIRFGKRQLALVDAAIDAKVKR